MDISVDIGKVIKEKRTKLGISQDRLSELANLTQGFIGQLERGNAKPSIDTLKAIINILNLDANLLFYEQAETNANTDWETYQMLLKLSPDKKIIIMDMIRLMYMDEKNSKKNKLKEKAKE